MGGRKREVRCVLGVRTRTRTSIVRGNSQEPQDNVLLETHQHLEERTLDVLDALQAQDDVPQPLGAADPGVRGHRRQLRRARKLDHAPEPQERVDLAVELVGAEEAEAGPPEGAGRGRRGVLGQRLPHALQERGRPVEREGALRREEVPAVARQPLGAVEDAEEGLDGGPQVGGDGAELVHREQGLQHQGRAGAVGESADGLWARGRGSGRGSS